MDATWKDHVDAQDAVTRAQNDARFAEVIAKIDGLPRAPSIWQIAGVVGAGFGLVLAALAFAADRFDGGISASGVLDAFEARQAARDDAQDARLDAILGELRALREDVAGGDAS